MDKIIMKRTVLLFSLLGLMIAAAGCSSDTNDNGAKSVTPAQTTTPDPVATPADGSLNNPAHIDDTVDITSNGNTYYLGVVNVMRGAEANNAIANANGLNAKPAPGYEYMIVSLGVDYVSGNESNVTINPHDFKVYSKGVECKSSNVVLPNNVQQMSATEVMKGKALGGVLVYQVPQNQEAILSYQPNKSDSSIAYISLELIKK